MRTVSPELLAAIDAVVTSPGHLVSITTTPQLLWSDIGQVSFPGGATYAAMDMSIKGIQAAGDVGPSQISISLGNLDSAVGALLLANDLNAVNVYINGIDRAVLEPVQLGVFNITQMKVGIDTAVLTCAPLFYTAPFRRVDEPNGFKFAAPAGTKITWGHEHLILDRLNDWYYPNG